MVATADLFTGRAGEATGRSAARRNATVNLYPAPAPFLSPSVYQSLKAPQATVKKKKKKEKAQKKNKKR